MCSTHTTKFDFQNALELAEDLRGRDSLSRLVILNDGRLFIDLLGKIFLSEFQF